MDDGICYRFRYGSFRIVGQFFSIVIFLPPLLPRIVPDKRHSILQLTDYGAGGILRG